MSAKNHDLPQQAAESLAGSHARRRFLKASGKAAAVAPAAVLLLSVASRSAHAAPALDNDDTLPGGYGLDLLQKP